MLLLHKAMLFLLGRIVKAALILENVRRLVTLFVGFVCALPLAF